MALLDVPGVDAKAQHRELTRESRFGTKHGLFTWMNMSRKDRLPRVVSTLVLVALVGCTSTRRFDVTPPRAATGNALRLVETDGHERTVKTGTVRTTDGREHALGSYLQLPSPARLPIERVEYATRRCGVNGGLIGGVLSVGIGAFLGATMHQSCGANAGICIDLGRGFSSLLGAAIGAVFSPVGVTLGSQVGRIHCNKRREVEIIP